MSIAGTASLETEGERSVALRAIEQRLDALVAISPGGPASRLVEAQRYTLLLPGKRARGLLTLMVAASWGAPWRKALDGACAVEMVHAASLIFDDLPCMDDAGMRRGQPAAHLAYSQPTAILAGIALMNEAFATLAADAALSAGQRSEAVTALAAAIGPQGLTGGQDEDMATEQRTPADVERIHRAKTGALFVAAAELGTICAGVSGARRIMIGDFAMCLGMAFQAFDDLIDVTGNEATAGKDVGHDREANLAKLLGVAGALERAEAHLKLAYECLDASGASSEAIRAHVESIAIGLRAKLASR